MIITEFTGFGEQLFNGDEIYNLIPTWCTCISQELQGVWNRGERISVFYSADRVLIEIDRVQCSNWPSLTKYQYSRTHIGCLLPSTVVATS